MNTAQKIVKYFAIGFAIFLIVSIFSAVIYGILGIATTIKLIDDHSSAEVECKDVEERCLQINLGFSSLTIKKGENLSVDTKNDKVNIEENGSRLIITEKGRHLFDNYNDREVTILVPEDMEFEKVAISGGAGNIYVEKLYAKTLEMALGVGETRIDALETDNAKISTGIGELQINLMSSADKYEVKVSKGIGNIRFNGSSVSKNSTLGSGSKKLDISGGIGAINITTFGN